MGNGNKLYHDSMETFIPAFAITNQDFPVTNHTQCVSKENLGWIKGITTDGTPFEAEIWMKHSVRGLAVLIPVCDFKPIGSYYQGDPDIPCFHNEVESVDEGVLHIGMFEEGVETELSVVQQYTALLKDYCMVTFTTDMENGYVEYVCDTVGNVFSRIVITLSQDDEIMATTNLLFTPFPANAKRRGLRYL